MSQQRVFTTDELVAESQEPQPEGVVIANAVEELWLNEREEEYSAAEERRAIAVGKAQVRRDAFDEVLRQIYYRYGYAPRMWAEEALCR